ncbi:restriction endonuclease subunit S [Acinetobacter indicus]|uniref:restriction endonuclease subunit S n=1 Tax=Acinetobacter indicus TaxID=756892 RepID=UPI001C080FBD|nr:restriction endonuclease subunit S [Acinetobacter indicus]
MFEKYDAYKDSGVEWLGRIPSDWEMISLKRSIEGCFNGLWGSDPKSNHDDIVVLRVADFNRNKLVIDNSKLTFRNIKKSEIGNRLLKKGDLLIEKSGGGDKTLVGCVVLFNEDYKALTSNFVAKMTPKSNVNSCFLNYIFASLYANNVNYQSIKQTTGIQNLDTNSYLNEKFALPSLPEQEAIVSFLNQKSSEIDQAIIIKEQQIALLNERKQIVIQKAVTQGLDPNVPMKDSCVEWIGQIPEHWKVVRAKYLFKEVEERSVLGNEELLSVSHLTGVTPRSEKNVSMFMAEDYSGSKLCKKHDLVMNIMWAWMGALGVSNYDGIVSPAYGVYRQKVANTFNSEYLEYLLKTTKYIEHYNRASTGLHSSRLRFYGHMFFNMKLGFPCLDEQNEIIASIKNQTSKIELAVENLTNQIEKLKEYKTTLINDAVTGKIKVA